VSAEGVVLTVGGLESAKKCYLGWAGLGETVTKIPFVRVFGRPRPKGLEFEFLRRDLKPGSSGFVGVEDFDGDAIRSQQCLIHRSDALGEGINGDEGGFHAEVVRVVNQAPDRQGLHIFFRKAHSLEMGEIAHAIEATLQFLFLEFDQFDQLGGQAEVKGAS
jgi:hypothetical protein